MHLPLIISYVFCFNIPHIHNFLGSQCGTESIPPGVERGPGVGETRPPSFHGGPPTNVDVGWPDPSGLILYTFCLGTSYLRLLTYFFVVP